jgi:hypothetical protein
MPDMHIHRVGKSDGPVEEFQSACEDGIFLYDDSGEWNIMLKEGGMSSGAPAVVVWIPTDHGVIILETSLMAFQAASRTMMAMAETHFGWTLPQ